MDSSPRTPFILANEPKGDRATYQTTGRLQLNRAQRRREAAIAVKKFRDDLALLGITDKQARRDLTKWDGVSEATMPGWMRGV